jgi:hypothetical protein
MKYPQPQTLLSPRQDLVDVTDVKLHQTFRYKKQYHVATTVSPRSFVGHDCAVLWWLCARQASPITALKPVITCFWHCKPLADHLDRTRPDDLDAPLGANDTRRSYRNGLQDKLEALLGFIPVRSYTAAVQGSILSLV